MNNEERKLIEAACRQRVRSYSPYSHFRVGAALQARDGRVYLGTNVEIASFGLSICAERAAVCSAVADGQREFTAIAVCADGVAPTSPCGACRQVLIEFGPDMVVLIAGRDGCEGEVIRRTTGELVPDAFVDYQANVRDEAALDGAGGPEGADR